jgi:hypothetical protein
MGGGPSIPAPPPPPPQPDWAGIFAAERAEQRRIMAKQRAEAEAQRQREEQQRRTEEASREQEQFNLQQQSRDQTAASDYASMKQAAAAQAVGGIRPVSSMSSKTSAPGLAPMAATAQKTPSAPGATAPMAGNMPMAPQGVGLGGGNSYNFLRDYMSQYSPR